MTVRLVAAAALLVVLAPMAHAQYSACLHQSIRSAGTFDPCDGLGSINDYQFSAADGGPLSNASSSRPTQSATVHAEVTPTLSGVTISGTNTVNISSICNQPPSYAGASTYNDFYGTFCVRQAGAVTIDVSCFIPSGASGSLALTVYGPQAGGAEQMQRYWPGSADEVIVINAVPGDFSYIMRMTLISGVVGTFNGTLDVTMSGYECWDPNQDDDNDGLINLWELSTAGIDANADGYFDFRPFGNGARPDHKDVFIEVDAVQSTNFDGNVLTDVVAAFANAPLQNPDGVSGINAHIAFDESDLQSPAPWHSPSQCWADEFDALANQHFGTVYDRLDSEWPAIRDAKLKVYRYGIIGPPLADGGAWGCASGGPGFWSQYFMTTMDGAALTHAHLQAKIILHEIGHTMGLGHGGGDDSDGKPNYVSVMNSLDRSAYDEGVPIDFSREQLASLDEDALDESSGLLSALTPNFEVPYARSLPGQPGARVVSVLPLDGSPVDFDGDGAITTSTTGDLNYFGASISGYFLPADFALPSAGELFVGHNDWASILLRNFATPSRDQTAMDHRTDLTYPTELNQQRYDAFGQIMRSVVTAVHDAPLPDAVRLRVASAPSASPVALQFTLPSEQRIALHVFDAHGRRVRTLAQRTFAAGTWNVEWDGSDARGHAAPSGAYFVKLFAGDGARTARITLAR